MESVNEIEIAESGTPGISPEVTPPFPCPPVPPLEPVSYEISEGSKESRNEGGPPTKKFRSWVWDHFEKIPCDNKNDQKAVCIYCNNQYVTAPSKGTSNLSNHLKSCKKYPVNIDEKQFILKMNASYCDGGLPSSAITSVTNWKFNQEEHRKALVKMIILDELPFRFVEREGFRRYMAKTQPRAIIPSRTTIARDALQIFMGEKTKLKEFFKSCKSRICLTTNTWTSCQNLSYMVLTAHFIDKNWKLHKKIINFCPIAGHSGEIIGRSIERCLIDWNIDKVLTLTVDNASSNDKCIDYLRERLNGWGESVLNGSLLHIRCIAHILSLVVKEGLKESSDHILRVRYAVRYVRSSLSRLSKFKTCVEQEKLESKRMLCLDIETRWNSTYIILDAAFKFKKAFDLMKRDKKYRFEMDKLKGMPMDDDWEHVRVLLPFLKYFYETTLRISGSLYVTGNMYLQEICGILKMISVARDGDDFDISVMALGMKSKYDKYWGSATNINVLLFIAMILDPRRKMKFVRWAINKYFESELAIDIHAKVDTTLKELYAFYASKLTSSSAPKPSSTMNVSEVICEHGDPVGREFEESVAAEITLAHGRNDLDKYLEDNLLVVGASFHILSWWRDNAINYEVLALMAKDLLAMPVSTIASESAFSTGGRVLDPFGSSLTPRMVEALVCTQDWIKSSSDHPQVEEIIEEIENIEADIVGLPPIVQIDESDISEFEDMIL